MGCKLPNSSVPGYWGGDPYKRIQAELIPEKIKALDIDKLYAMGKDVLLWKEVTLNTPGVLECSCVKDTTNRSDITCASCYGGRYIPGYDQFLHETLFVASISSGLTLVNTSINTIIKPNRILLNDGQTSGTITSSAISYSNPSGFNWTYRVDVPNIKSTNSVTIEFSTDNTNWYPIANINNAGIKPVGTGSLYLRATLTRANVEDRSPEFEIIRVRHPKVARPYIKILRPPINEIPTLLQQGLRMEQVAEKFWTVPLDVFDSSITPDTPEARILENSFYERINGINQGNRYVISKLMYNEELTIFTRQEFDTRRVQPEEVYARLVF